MKNRAIIAAVLAMVASFCCYRVGYYRGIASVPIQDCAAPFIIHGLTYYGDFPIIVSNYASFYMSKCSFYGVGTWESNSADLELRP